MTTTPAWDETDDDLEAQAAAEVTSLRPRRSEQSQGRVPPHNLDAERALLGALLLSRDAVAAAAEVVPAADVFYRPAHAHIYETITVLTARGEAIDVITVADELRRRDHLDASGGPAALVELQADAPGTANAAHYARIVRDHAQRRRGIGLLIQAEEALWTGGDVSDALDQIKELHRLTSDDHPEGRLVDGGSFVLDAPPEPPALWGRGQEVLWAQGEPLLVVGPPGVGKSTLAGQLVKGRVGRSAELLGYPLTTGRRSVLYLAMDRPAQIQRSLARQFTPDERPVLNDRLIVWKGPPPRDLAQHPETLIQMARDAAADTVIIDSLKDAAIGLSDDEVGAGLNRAMQDCVADGVEVCALHHQRKGQNGAQPKRLEDIYGSTWISAGAGSVVLLWGQAGDPLVDLIHLKQPADEIGPLKIEHHGPEGALSVYQSFDALAFLRARGQDGTTATEAARVMFEKSNPTDTERKKTQRQLERLVRDGLADKNAAALGGAGGSAGARYRISLNCLQEPA